MKIFIYSVLLIVVCTNCYAQTPKLIVETGHSGQVWALAMHPSGDIFVTAGDDETFIVFDSQTGKEIFRYYIGARLSEPGAVRFSPDGTRLAVVSGESIKIWRIGSWELIKSIPSPYGSPRSLVFSRDSMVLAWQAGYKTIVWDLLAEQVKRVFESVALSKISFHTHANILATCSEGIELLDIGNGTRQPFGSKVASKSQCSSITVSPDGSKVAVSRYDGSISAYDYQSGKEIYAKTISNSSVSLLWPKENLLLAFDSTVAMAIDPKDWNSSVVYEGDFSSVQVIGYSPKFNTLIVVHGPALNPVMSLKKLDTAALINKSAGSNWMISAAAFAKGGHFLATNLDSYIDVWNLVAGKRQCRLISPRPDRIFSMAFSDRGDSLESYSGSAIDVWDVKNCRLKTDNDVASQMYFSSSAMSDKLQFAVDEQYGELSIHDFSSEERQIVRFPKDGSYSCRLAFSPDGSLLARASKQGSIKIFDLSLKKQINEMTMPGGACLRLGFSPDNEILAAVSNDRLISLFRVNDGSKLVSFPGTLYSPGNITLENIKASDGYIKSIIVRAVGAEVDSPIWPDKLSVGTNPAWPWKSTDGIVAYDPDSNRRVSITEGRVIRFWEQETPSIMLEFSAEGAFLKQSAIKQPSDAESLKQRGRGELGSLIPFPNLIWAVVAPDGRFDANELDDIQGLHWIFPDNPFRPLPPEIFMRQFYEPRLLPRMMDSVSNFQPIPPMAALNRVQPKVEIKSIHALKDSPNSIEVVVKVSSGSSQQMRDGRRVTLHSGAFDLRVFRDGQLVGYKPGDLKLGVSGEVTIPFSVRLVHRGDSSEVEFTAYAFNLDRVKSATANYTYKPALPLRAKKGRAYVISVGVNAYEDEAWDLSFAASDARATSDILVKELSATKAYSEVVPITLTSDYNKSAGVRTVTEKTATKRAFRAILGELSGRPGKIHPSVLRCIRGAERLKKAEPEDLILITFSSHGYIDLQGKFYLVPFDTGGKIQFEPDGQEIIAKSLSHFISSDELSQWVRNIDVGELVMVVDTCHSASAVEEPGFKPGPMGSRGMGQLAYDKGMRILAASQASDVALEVDSLKQGLLTYALVREGLEKGAADKDKNGKITLDEWLDYGADRVPGLYDDVKAGRVGELKSKDIHITSVLTGASVKKNAFQQPQLFDFKRKRREIVLAQDH